MCLLSIKYCIHLIQMNVWRQICLLWLSSGKAKKPALLGKEHGLRGQGLDLSNRIKNRINRIRVLKLVAN